MDWVTQYSQWMLENGLEDYSSHDYGIHKPRKETIELNTIVNLCYPNYKDFSNKKDYEEYLNYYEENKLKEFKVVAVEDDIITLDSGFKVNIKNLFNIDDDDIPF